MLRGVVQFFCWHACIRSFDFFSVFQLRGRAPRRDALTPSMKAACTDSFCARRRNVTSLKTTCFSSCRVMGAASVSIAWWLAMVRESYEDSGCDPGRYVPDGEPSLLNELRQRCHSVETPWRTRSSLRQGPSIISEDSPRGVRSLWSLNSLHNDFTHQDPVSIGSWCQIWWLGGRKLCGATTGEVGCHPKMPALTRQAGRSSPTCFLNCVTMSTFAMNILMTRWANNTKSKVSKNARVQDS